MQWWVVKAWREFSGTAKPECDHFILPNSVQKLLSTLNFFRSFALTHVTSALALDNLPVKIKAASREYNFAQSVFCPVHSRLEYAR